MKRVYRRTEKSKRFRKPKNKEKAIKTLETTGILNDNLSPSMINPRMLYQHNRIICIDNMLKHIEENKEEFYNKYGKEKVDKFIIKMKNKRKIALERFINLCLPLIHTLIKRYLIDGYNDDFKHSAIADIISTLFEKRKYSPEKSSITSYVFEIAKQTIFREFVNFLKYDRNKLKLISDI